MAIGRFSGKEIEDFCVFVARIWPEFSTGTLFICRKRVEPLLADFSCRTLSDIILRAKRDLKLRMDLLNNLRRPMKLVFRHPEHSPS